MKSYQLKIHPFAELELKDSSKYYNSQKENLGDEFIFEIEKVLALIQQNPK